MKDLLTLIGTKRAPENEKYGTFQLHDIEGNDLGLEVRHLILFVD